MEVGAHLPRSARTYPYRHMIGGQGVPGVTDILDDLRLRHDYSMVRPEVLEAAALRGQAVHDFSADRLAGTREVSTWPEIADPFVQAWRRWRDLAQPVPYLVEHEVLVGGHPAFGGTLDLFGLASGWDTVLDFKCRPVVPGDGLQVVGYQRGLVLDPKWGDRTRAARRQVVELKNNGRFKVHQYDDPEDLRVFVAAACLWHWRRRQGWMPDKH